eukprot:TRINITY_DN12869_c0_g1_i1.p1 TRINITY_DN12869_c0_g1~~TRINITY_DN12869_c0_g1_i1.p1  ORF type:complete len:204 (+),score=-12.72 TRINITY_DN12869_c0_g1_i1:184-795(+)
MCWMQQISSFLTKLCKQIILPRKKLELRLIIFQHQFSTQNLQITKNKNLSLKSLKYAKVWIIKGTNYANSTIYRVVQNAQMKIHIQPTLTNPNCLREGFLKRVRIIESVGNTQSELVGSDYRKIPCFCNPLFFFILFVGQILVSNEQYCWFGCCQQIVTLYSQLSIIQQKFVIEHLIPQKSSNETSQISQKIPNIEQLELVRV